MYFMQGLPRYTVTYCQYGERRQKPTDIWTKHPNPKFKPPCKCGSSDSRISNICSGKSGFYTAKGFHWRYAE